MSTYNPGTGPYNNPQITIANPLAPPGQQLTNFATLINGGHKEAGVLIYRNGILLTEGYDFSRNQGIVNFSVAPLAGDTLTALVFAIGRQLGGTTPERYVSPWSLPLVGSGTQYGIVFGPTISGGIDGVNPLFQWSPTFQRVQLWRNGIYQTATVDYNAGTNALVFLAGAIPQPGDILTLLGFNNC